MFVRSLLLAAQAAAVSVATVFVYTVVAQEDGEEPRAASPLGTGFAYQGRLVDDGMPVSGTCDFTYGLWDSATGGMQLGGSQSATLPVTNGLFTAVLNEAGQFGTDAFSGDARWLEVAAGCGGEAVEVLGRQPLTPAPYAFNLRPGATVRGPGSGNGTAALSVEGAVDGDVGLTARGGSPGTPDIVLGGTMGSGGTLDDGVIASDPTVPSSDIIMRSNDQFRIDLNADGSVENGGSSIRVNNQGSDNTVFLIDEEGNLEHAVGGFGLPKLVADIHCSGDSSSIVKLETTVPDLDVTISANSSTGCYVFFPVDDAMFALFATARVPGQSASATWIFQGVTGKRIGVSLQLSFGNTPTGGNVFLLVY